MAAEFALTRRALSLLRALLVSAFAFTLGGADGGCEAGCTREVSLTMQRSAAAYVARSVELHQQLADAKSPPYRSALVKLRGLAGAGRRIDWRLMSMAERQLALSGLLGVDRDEEDDALLARLVADAGIDPFVPDPYGAVPFAAAFGYDHAAALLMLPKLRSYPRTRPTDALLCGLRGERAPATLATLRGYCPCARED